MLRDSHTHLLQTLNLYPLITIASSKVIKTKVAFKVKVFSFQNLLDKGELVTTPHQTSQVCPAYSSKKKIELLHEKLFFIFAYF